ncbi:hypothetical protein E2C01_070709 [Portunus trituberculatus]|uniref:Uncharacterized protein n=1 Tax=Portunus trituberculatus TaxID=210409 RepID=A0A5B7I305_PORTR|nr:hypothetical protein [Portunus trituberculatus]
MYQQKPSHYQTFLINKTQTQEEKSADEVKARRKSREDNTEQEVSEASEQETRSEMKARRGVEKITQSKECEKSEQTAKHKLK